MSPDNLEARVTKLESQVHQLSERVRASEQDAAAARVLAGAADRDVTEFRDELRDFRRATTASFNAVREDITDLRERLDRVDARFSQVDERFDRVDARFNQVDERFDRVDARFNQVDERFDRVDARFNDVDARFNDVDARFNDVDARFNDVDARFNEVDNGFIGIRGKLDAAAAGQQHIVELLERLIADQD
jgi:archaellum component FlaC